MSVQIKGSGTIGGIDEGLNVVGISTFASLVNINVNASQSTSTPLLLQNTAAAGTLSNPDVVKLGFGSQGIAKASIRADVYGNGNLTFHTNNDSEKVRITAAGDVGINTNNPVVKLDISEDSVAFPTPAGSTLLRLRNSGGSATLSIDSNAGNVGAIQFGDTAAASRGTISYHHATDSLQCNTSGSERLRITSDGKIGIGEDDPDGNYLLIRAASTVGTNKGHIMLTGDSATNGQGPQIVFSESGSGSSFAGAYIGHAREGSNSTGSLIFATRATSGDANTVPTERLRIMSDGEIKINHTQSSTPLNNTFISIYDANSDSSAIDASGVSKNYAMISLHNYGTGVVGDATGIGFGAGSGFSYTKGSIAFMRQGSYGTGDLVFLTNNDQNTTMVNDTDEKMRITRDGLIQVKSLSGSYYPIASVKDGSTSARAATSAWEIKKTLGPRAKTGYYYLINPYDSSINTWWCDMTTDGGGWILIAHSGEGNMADQGTTGAHWWSRNNKGGFDSVGSGYYTGGGYWRTSAGAWAANTCGQLMWDVRTHLSEFNNKSNDKVVFNWGTDQAIPSGNSSYSNIPNAGNRRFADWCYAVENAPGYNPSQYHQNVRSTTLNGANHFTEHMVMTWSMRGTGGAGDGGENGPYWMIGSHANGLHQHYEESLSGDANGDGSYQVVSNEDTGWGGGGTNNGYRRIARNADAGTCNIWLR